MAQGIQHEPKFYWWVHYVLKKRGITIFMVRWHSAQYLKRTNKFWLKLPKMVNEAYAVDEKDGNTLWQDAVQKEMENVKIALQIISMRSHLIMYVNCHMVLDIKMEDFKRKACLVVGDHMTHTPDVITYSSVVTRETVHIALNMALLHDL